MINHFKYLLIILFSSISFATNIHVATTGSDDTGDGTEGNPYATIQKGVDNSANDDTVTVHPGIYYGKVEISNNDIALVSHSGPDDTFIDGNNLNHSYGLITLRNNSGDEPDTSMKIIGFSIQNSNSVGIYIEGRSVIIENCKIKDNIDPNPFNGGGGIYINDASQSVNVILESSIISNNIAEIWDTYYDGGGIWRSYIYRK